MSDLNVSDKAMRAQNMAMTLAGVPCAADMNDGVKQHFLAIARKEKNITYTAYDDDGDLPGFVACVAKIVRRESLQPAHLHDQPLSLILNTQFASTTSTKSTQLINQCVNVSY
jgi:hypothetical protein